ncbi:MAG: hypothetical protein HY801_08250 [Candidatus Lindowbacteria bacterium]|nr:hypothetical protein [Candidatus Lindowbacteria bacterium]
MKKVTIILIVLALGVGGFFFYKQVLPHPDTSAEAYFEQYEKHKLTSDVEMQLRGIQDQFLNAFVTDFRMYKDMPPIVYRYPIAFTSYALACVAKTDPSYQPFCSHYMDKLIQKMKQKEVWEDWIQAGFGPDPMAKQNIMYRGHLNLMYGLYQMTSGDTKYEKEYKALAKALHDEMKQTEKQGKYCGMSCEPDDYFVQCNTIGMYSMAVYDTIYKDANYSDVIGPWLAWTKKRMVETEHGVLRNSYHMEHDYAEQLVTGYGTGWSIAFLMALDPEFARSLYPQFKKTFIHEKLGGLYCYASEVPGSGKPDDLATVCALYAAKAMNDKELFGGLINSLDRVGAKKVDGNMLVFDKLPSPVSGMMLFGKVNPGLEKLIDQKDWAKEATAQEEES